MGWLQNIYFWFPGGGGGGEAPKTYVKTDG